jgi:hypothetical protein
VRLGVSAMGGKTGGNLIEIRFQTLNPKIKSVNLFTQHLLTLKDKVKLVLEIFALNRQLMAKFTNNFPPELVESTINNRCNHFGDSLQIVFVHARLRLCKTLRGQAPFNEPHSHSASQSSS